MPLPLDQQVVVITGASSGIGRAAALRFGRAGAAVVLAARNQEALRQVEREITAEGGRALVVPADVADPNHVQRVAQTAVQHFGRIDTWVNNAAVSVYGRFEDVPLPEFKRVLEVNVMGQVHGAQAALPHLRASGGTLIGIGSVLSDVPVPLLTAYTASKHALKGFYDSLRLEQMHEQSGVRVSFLMPDSVNTPLFDHAVTHLGVKPAPFPPVYEPEVVANAILHAAQHPVRDARLTASAMAFAALDTVAPGYADRVFERIGYSRQFTNEPKPPNGPNNLYRTLGGPGSVRGSFVATPFDPLSWLRERPPVRRALTAVGLAAIAFPVLGFALRAAFGGCSDLDFD
jgi:NAD(P)-dependent dehydrogenase (short-subunit alcohol dehydrogenase family)